MEIRSKMNMSELKKKANNGFAWCPIKSKLISVNRSASVHAPLFYVHISTHAVYIEQPEVANSFQVPVNRAHLCVLAHTYRYDYGYTKRFEECIPSIDVLVVMNGMN